MNLAQQMGTDAKENYPKCHWRMAAKLDKLQDGRQAGRLEFEDVLISNALEIGCRQETSFGWNEWTWIEGNGRTTKQPTLTGIIVVAICCRYCLLHLYFFLWTKNNEPIYTPFCCSSHHFALQLQCIPCMFLFHPELFIIPFCVVLLLQQSQPYRQDIYSPFDVVCVCLWDNLCMQVILHKMFLK